jgi:D-alanyl-D-alanine carboxypeptidase (penicillin-binding protein 5/6)
MQDRRIETEQMVRWAFANFQPVRFFDQGETAGAADVWMGAVPTVELRAPRDLHMLVPVEARGAVTARVVYAGPIEAPVAEGAEVAELVVEVPGRETVRFPLVAAAEVPRGGLVRRLESAASLARDRALALVGGD